MRGSFKSNLILKSAPTKNLYGCVGGGGGQKNHLTSCVDVPLQEHQNLRTDRTQTMSDLESSNKFFVPQNLTFDNLGTNYFKFN